MRSLALLALVLATGIAACGGVEEPAPAPASWDGPGFPLPADGEVPVDAFRVYAESVDEPWERDPAAVAREFARLPAAAVTVDGRHVTVLKDGLEDDSVRALRYELELEQGDDVWTVAAANWAQRCHEQRGHQQFSPALCV